jgi:hypothetical protein
MRRCLQAWINEQMGIQATLGRSGRWEVMSLEIAWFQPDPDHHVLELPGAELHFVTTSDGIACAWWTFITEGWVYAIVGKA